MQAERMVQDYKLSVGKRTSVVRRVCVSAIEGMVVAVREGAHVFKCL
jgi:hypothetical protein